MKLDIQKMKEEHQYGVRDSEDKFITSFTKGKCYRDEQLGYELFDRLLLTPLTYERVLEIDAIEEDIKWDVKYRRKCVKRGDTQFIEKHDINHLKLKQLLVNLKKELKQSPEFNLRFDTTDLSAYKEVA
jgi:hypothetical protein